MTEGRQPRVGPGLFQWDTGGWFGPQIGGTLWILLCAFRFVSTDAPLAGFLFGLFLFVNVVGMLLWVGRDRIPPYGALQGLVALLGLVSLAAIVAMDSAGRLGDFEPRLQDMPRMMYWGLAIFPAMMALFHVRELGALRGRRGQTDRA